MLRSPENGSTYRTLAVEASRTYRDRLVLKLHGIDDGDAAASLRGSVVAVAPDDVPELPEGRYWLERLIGLRVFDEVSGRDLGVVVDVVETGAGEVLAVRPDGNGSDSDDDILVPLVREFVVEVDAAAMRVRLPEDLLRLNRDGQEG